MGPTVGIERTWGTVENCQLKRVFVRWYEDWWGSGGRDEEERGGERTTKQ